MVPNLVVIVNKEQSRKSIHAFSYSEIDKDGVADPAMPEDSPLPEEGKEEARSSPALPFLLRFEAESSPRVPPEISCTGIDQCLAHRADGTAMDEQGIKHVAWDSISRILDSDDSRAILLFYRNRDIRFLADGLLAFNTTLSSTC